MNRSHLETCILFTLAALVYRNPELTWSAKTSIAQLPVPSHIKSSPRGSQWTLEAAAGAFINYEATSRTEIDKMRASYTRMSQSHQSIGEALMYPSKLDKMAHAEKSNAITTKSMASLAVKMNGLNETAIKARKEGAVFRVREALQHLVRDWSEEGEEERRATFRPILDVLREVPEDERGEMKVLVPGAGLGRLAWEISELGFQSTANELSPYMNLATRFLLDPSTTPSTLFHQIHPWAHRLSHQRTVDTVFRAIPVPDVLPRKSSRFDMSEGDFLQLGVPARLTGSKGYDVVVTQFFIDASSNVAAIIEQIHRLLVSGGTWINVGPLLWAGGGVATMELSLEEVMKAVEMIGFEVQDGSSSPTTRPRSVPCEYTSDRLGMFRRIYEAEFWVATKA